MNNEPESLGPAEQPIDPERLDTFDVCTGGLSGICWAGAIYPSVGYIVFLLAGGIRNVGLIGLVIGLLATMTLGACYCACAALFVGMIAAMIVSLVQVCMNHYFSDRTLVAATGGLTGFGSTFFIGLSNPSDMFTSAFACGLVLLAMLLGQVGALRSVANSSSLGTRPFVYSRSDNRNQFRIWHLMLLTAFVALVMAMGRVISSVIPVLVAVYVGLQCSLIGIDYLRLSLRTAKLVSTQQG